MEFNKIKELHKNTVSKKIQKTKQPKQISEHAQSFNIDDSVMVYPDKKIGLIFQKTDDKGMLGVQINGIKVLLIIKG